jgi:hypothetical protein
LIHKQCCGRGQAILNQTFFTHRHSALAQKLGIFLPFSTAPPLLVQLLSL